MAFFRTSTAPKIIAATTIAAAIPAASFAFNSTHSSSSSSRTPPKKFNLSYSIPSFSQPISKNLVNSSLNVVQMDSPTSTQNHSTQNGFKLPELLTEFMVDMKCEGCVNSVKSKLQTVDGVKNVEVDLTNQVVRILGSSPVKNMTEPWSKLVEKPDSLDKGFPKIS